MGGVGVLGITRSRHGRQNTDTMYPSASLQVGQGRRAFLGVSQTRGGEGRDIYDWRIPKSPFFSRRIRKKMGNRKSRNTRANGAAKLTNKKSTRLPLSMFDIYSHRVTFYLGDLLELGLGLGVVLVLVGVVLLRELEVLLLKLRGR